MIFLETIGLIFFFCLGLYLFLFGFKKFLFSLRLKNKGQNTSGLVVDLKKENQTYIPVISFVDYKNQNITGIAKNSSPIKKMTNHKIGDNVKIYYNATNSSEFIIDESSDKLITLFFCLGGLVFISAVIYDILRRF